MALLPLITLALMCGVSGCGTHARILGNSSTRTTWYFIPHCTRVFPTQCRMQHAISYICTSEAFRSRACDRRRHSSSDEATRQHHGPHHGATSRQHLQYLLYLSLELSLEINLAIKALAGPTWNILLWSLELYVVFYIMGPVCNLLYYGCRLSCPLPI